MGNGIVEEKVTGERFYLSADFVWNEKDEETTYYDHDTNKYYIYIGSENDSKIWSYGTVDLTTGKISWEDNL